MAITTPALAGLLSSIPALFIIYLIFKKRMKGGIKSYVNLEYPEEKETISREEKGIARSGERIGGNKRRTTFELNNGTTTSPGEQSTEAGSESDERNNADKQLSRKFKWN